MTANSITREGSGEAGRVIYAYRPGRTRAYVGVGILVFVAAFLTLACLEIGPFTLVLPIILAVILVPVGVVLVAGLFKTPYGRSAGDRGLQEGRMASVSLARGHGHLADDDTHA